MGALKELGLVNFRSLRDLTPPVRLAPITILLGKNSVGKSSFARVFPLLRQSSERKKRAPVLWYGDLVDFGSLSRTVTEGESEITFHFQIEYEPPFRRTDVGLYQKSQKRRSKFLADVSLTLAEDATQNIGYAKKLRFKTLGKTVDLEMAVDPVVSSPIKVDGVPWALPKEFLVATFQGQLLPLLHFYVDKKSADGNSTWAHLANPWDEWPTTLVRKAVHHMTSTSTCRKISRQIPIGTIAEVESVLTSISGPSSWTALVNDPSQRRNLAVQLQGAVFGSHLGEILQQIDAALASCFGGVRYLKPLRATAQRYYRRLDLAISEIDPEGGNLHMFLDSLAERDLTSFRQWLKTFLDMDAYPQREGDQIMVMSRGKHDAKAYNIADMGFGISQVLPIAAQLWATTRSLPQTSPASIVVLEQPELHLHPDFQARLADVFVGTVKADTSGRPTPSLIVETHSQHLVNRLGQLIEAGRLSPEDVSVVLFEASGSSTQSTTVRVAEFGNDGILKNWPYGFFEPES